MVLSSDIKLANTLWNDSETKLCEGFIFERLVDLFIVACSIGIKDDKIMENDMTDDDNPRSIGRATYLLKNEDLTSIITFLFQNAVLNSKTIDYDNETRLRLAFDPDFPDKKSKIQFSPTNFLVKFASYGLSKIYEVEDNNDLTYIMNIKKLIDDYSLNDFDDILDDLDINIEEIAKI